MRSEKSRRLRPVRFTFEVDDGEGPTFPGWTDDTFWNGYLNVKISPATREAVVAWLRASPADCEESVEELASASIDRDGLINLGDGWSTVEAGGPADHETHPSEV